VINALPVAAFVRTAPEAQADDFDRDIECIGCFQISVFIEYFK
jgi:hypothetical protein